MNARFWARAAGVVAAVAVMLGWVWFAPFSLLGTANLALAYAMIAISLVVLTGWVGQISLAQASFVGIGAFVTGVITRAWSVPFPVTLPVAALAAAGAAAALGVVALRVRGLYLAVATLIFAWMAQEYLFNQPWLAGVGGSASAPTKPLGTQGAVPYLDFSERRTFYFVMLATLAAALIAMANLRDSKTGRAWFAVKGSEIAAASLGVAVTRYKLLAFAVSGFLAGAGGSLVITHQQVATSDAFAPNVSLFYLAIAVVGGLASLGGAVASGALFASLEELFFRIDALQGFLQIVSALLLAVVLLFFPAGLAGVPHRLATPVRRGAAGLAGEFRRLYRLVVAGVRRWRRFRASLEQDRVRPEADAPTEASTAVALEASPALPTEPGTALAVDASPALAPPVGAPVDGAGMDPGWYSDPGGAKQLRWWDGHGWTPHVWEDTSGYVPAEHRPPAQTYVPGTATKVDLPPREQRPVVLAARDITVRFGGLTAVDKAQLVVNEGEIVGLIGPNGAGKTTLFNAVSGLNEPTEGTVEFFGSDITRLAVHERARLGMGRTFQMIQLFPQLSVFENLLVATHNRNPTGFFGHLLASPRAVDEEFNARVRVSQVVDLLGLGEVAKRPVAGLPFGVLRMVEVARALVTGAPFVMLDEPASGLDNAETERLTDLLLWVRQSLGVALLVIEHDVKMVTGLSDYMYVIERGKPIAEGTPAEIQRNEAVIAAYLGKASDGADADAAGAGERVGDAVGAHAEAPTDPEVVGV